MTNVMESTVSEYSPLESQEVCLVCLPTTFLDIRAKLFYKVQYNNVQNT